MHECTIKFLSLFKRRKNGKGFEKRKCRHIRRCINGSNLIPIETLDDMCTLRTQGLSCNKISKVLTVRYERIIGISYIHKLCKKMGIQKGVMNGG